MPGASGGSAGAQGDQEDVIDKKLRERCLAARVVFILPGEKPYGAETNPHALAPATLAARKKRHKAIRARLESAERAQAATVATSAAAAAERATTGGLLLELAGASTSLCEHRVDALTLCRPCAPQRGGRAVPSTGSLPSFYAVSGKV